MRGMERKQERKEPGKRKESKEESRNKWLGERKIDKNVG